MREINEALAGGMTTDLAVSAPRHRPARTAQAPTQPPRQRLGKGMAGRRRRSPEGGAR
eukprot:SAG11_NODE_4115_length_2059_cov_2.811735_1_plen_57_part_10